MEVRSKSEATRNAEGYPLKTIPYILTCCFIRAVLLFNPFGLFPFPGFPCLYRVLVPCKFGGVKKIFVFGGFDDLLSFRLLFFIHFFKFLRAP